MYRAAIPGACPCVFDTICGTLDMNTGEDRSRWAMCRYLMVVCVCESVVGGITCLKIASSTNSNLCCTRSCSEIISEQHLNKFIARVLYTVSVAVRRDNIIVQGTVAEAVRKKQTEEKNKANGVIFPHPAINFLPHLHRLRPRQ